MIDDNTIDELNAKYWCLFMDTEIAELLDKAGEYDADDGKKLALVLKKGIEQQADEKENVQEGMWDNVNAMHQAAFPMATGNPFLPNFRAMDVDSGVPSLQDLQKNNAIAGGVVAAFYGLAALPAGWFAGIGSAVCGAAGAAGAWLSSIAGSIGMSGVMAIVGGLVTVSTYLYPRIAKMLKGFVSGGETIAKCLFEADGLRYESRFDAKRGRWMLDYVGQRWTKSGVNVPKGDVKRFFESKFFERFRDRCMELVNRVYSDLAKMKQLETLTKMADKQSQKALKRIVDAKSVTLAYMATGKYVTESCVRESKRQHMGRRHK